MIKTVWRTTTTFYPQQPQGATVIRFHKVMPRGYLLYAEGRSYQNTVWQKTAGQNALLI